MSVGKRLEGAAGAAAGEACPSERSIGNRGAKVWTSKVRSAAQQPQIKDDDMLPQSL